MGRGKRPNPSKNQEPATPVIEDKETQIGEQNDNDNDSKLSLSTATPAESCSACAASTDVHYRREQTRLILSFYLAMCASPLGRSRGL